MAETVDKSGTIGGLLITNADKVGAGLGSIIGAIPGKGGGVIIPPFNAGAENQPSEDLEEEQGSNLFMWLGIGGAVLALVLFFFLTKK